MSVSSQDQSNFKRFADPGSKGILGWGHDADEGRKGPPAPPPGQPGAPATEQFSTREQDLQRRAAGAGARRSENDADLLGFTTTATRGAARKILGY